DRHSTDPSSTAYPVRASSTVTTAPTAGTTAVPGSTGTDHRTSGGSSSGRRPPASAVTSTGRASSIDAVKAHDPANAAATATATQGTGCAYHARRGPSSGSPVRPRAAERGTPRRSPCAREPSGAPGGSSS